MTVLWLLLAAGLALGCLAAIATGQRFAPGMPRDDMPMLVFALALSAAGALFLLARPLLQCTAGMAAPAGWRCGWIGAFGVGLGLRLLLLASEPILEVDFNRYLWDGGTVARGYNPYAVAPARIGALPYDDPRLELSKAAGSVFDQISYSERGNLQGAQFYAVAGKVYEAAKRAGLGREIPTEWFLQDIRN